MKKLLSILCLCTMLFGLVGCSKQTPKICDVGESGGASIKLETTFRSSMGEEYVDEKAPKTATVEFMGQQYTGKYKRTWYAANNPYPYLEYEFDNVLFDIGENGKLYTINLKTKSNNFSQEEQRSDEKYIELATQAAMQFSDVTDWKVTIRPTHFDKNGTITAYFVKFVKHLGEMPTSEEIGILILSDGYVKSVSSFMLGEFDEGIAEDKFDYEAIEQQVLERMQEIYGPDDSDTESSYTVKFTLDKENNGKVVLIADASRRVYKKSEDVWHSGGFVSFIVR